MELILFKKIRSYKKQFTLFYIFKNILRDGYLKPLLAKYSQYLENEYMLNFFICLSGLLKLSIKVITLDTWHWIPACAGMT